MQADDDDLSGPSLGEIFAEAEATPPSQHSWDKYAQDRMIDFLIVEENHFEDKSHHVIGYVYAAIFAAIGIWGVFKSLGPAATIDWWSLASLPAAVAIVIVAVALQIENRAELKRIRRLLKLLRQGIYPRP